MSVSAHLQLHTACQYLLSDTEGALLYNNLEEKGGKIETLTQLPDQAKASWSWAQNTVQLDASLLENIPNMLGYLAFELSNAAQTSVFQQIASDSSLSLDDRVRQIEAWEYQSAIRAHHLVHRILGPDVDFDLKYLCDSFDTHYLLQQLSGHSKILAEKCQKPGEIYTGTPGFQNLTKEQKDCLYGLLYYSARSQCPEHQGMVPLMIANLSRLAEQDPAYKKLWDIWTSTDHTHTQLSP